VVFPVTPAQATDVAQALDLPYPIYADEDRALFSAYETRFAAGAPIPAWIVGDADGTIRFLWRGTEGPAWTDYPEGAEILEVLRGLPPA